MKIWKKLLAAVLIVGCLALPAAAKEVETAANINSQSFSSSGEVAMPYAEVKEWHYRYYNGRPQRRLWSVTYGRWLTDWEYCD